MAGRLGRVSSTGKEVAKVRKSRVILRSAIIIALFLTTSTHAPKSEALPSDGYEAHYYQPTGPTCWDVVEVGADGRNCDGSRWSEGTTTGVMFKVDWTIDCHGGGDGPARLYMYRGGWIPIRNTCNLPC
jgi:hypothetical protein